VPAGTEDDRRINHRSLPCVTVTVTVTVTVDYTGIFKDINNSPCIAVEEFAPLPEFVPHNLAGFHDGITRIPE
jgi:hypothetical protein